MAARSQTRTLRLLGCLWGRVQAPLWSAQTVCTTSQITSFVLFEEVLTWLLCMQAGVRPGSPFDALSHAGSIPIEVAAANGNIKMKTFLESCSLFRGTLSMSVPQTFGSKIKKRYTPRFQSDFFQSMRLILPPLSVLTGSHSNAEPTNLASTGTALSSRDSHLEMQHPHCGWCATRRQQIRFPAAASRSAAPE